MDFENEQVAVHALPSIDQLNYQGIQKDYLKLTLIYATINNLILGAALIAFFIFKPFELPLIAWYAVPCIYLIRLVWLYVSSYKSFNYKSYAIREKDIVYRSGWLWRSTVTAPFNRVQHLQIDQGPLERKMGLSKLKIFTAGGNSSDITIPGLRPQEARNIKQFIVGKTAMDEEE